MSEPKHVTIYTDGACLGNPGPGGYGVILEQDGRRKELSGGFRNTTNNRMEIMAVIVGLETLKQRCCVTVYSDSQYLVKAIDQGWAVRWKANGWKRNKKDDALNPDLWDRLLKLCAAHDIKFRWVKGHSNHAENERCDALATTAAAGRNLPVDKGYTGEMKRKLS